MRPKQFITIASFYKKIWGLEPWAAVVMFIEQNYKEEGIINN